MNTTSNDARVNWFLRQNAVLITERDAERDRAESFKIQLKDEHQRNNRLGTKNSVLNDELQAERATSRVLREALRSQHQDDKTIASLQTDVEELEAELEDMRAARMSERRTPRTDGSHGRRVKCIRWSERNDRRQGNVDRREYKECRPCATRCNYLKALVEEICSKE